MTNPIDELIEKLRNHSAFVFVDDARLMHDAASTLTSLQERNRKLEEALREYVYETTHLSPCEDDGSHWCCIPGRTLARARDLLSGGSE